MTCYLKGKFFTRNPIRVYQQYYNHCRKISTESSNSIELSTDINAILKEPKLHYESLQVLRDTYPHDFALFANIITEEEERQLVNDLQVLFKKKKYINNHWDSVISFYKEIELDENTLNDHSRNIFDRCRKFIDDHTKNNYEYLPLHAIELAPQGHIGKIVMAIQNFEVLNRSFTPFLADAHVDSVKFSGELVSGLSLLSDRVLTLLPSDSEGNVIDSVNSSNVTNVKAYAFLVPSRSLYFIKGSLRYEYAHSILGVNHTTKRIPTKKRISVMFRDKVANDPFLPNIKGH